MAIVGTKAEIEKLQAEIDKQLGYPSKDHHIGGGIHVEISETPGIGWTITHAYPQEHPVTKGLWALDTRGADEAVIDAAKADAGLTAKPETPLDDEWKPKSDTPLEAKK